MSRRGNNEGTIKRRSDGRWEARLTLPDGKRKSLYGKTRQEVARLLAAATRERDRGALIASDERQTFATFLSGWLQRVQPTVRPRTWNRYRELLAHATDRLGGAALGKLTAAQVEHLYAHLLQQEGLSSTTVHHLHTVLHHALSDALRKGLVAHNVCTLVDAPRMRRHRAAPLSPGQAQTLLATAAHEGVRLEALYVLALTTGMRQGELLALHWADMDLDAAALHVRGTLQRSRGALTVAEPKTAHSRRRVALTGLAVAALRTHRARQLEERLLLGPEWEDHDLVFCRLDGRPLDGTNLLRTDFYPLLERAGLPRVRFHDLRHSAATLLLAQGIHPKIVSELLGHTTIRVTMDIYSHVLPDMQREAVAAMERLLTPAPTPPTPSSAAVAPVRDATGAANVQDGSGIVRIAGTEAAAG